MRESSVSAPLAGTVGQRVESQPRTNLQTVIRLWSYDVMALNKYAYYYPTFYTVSYFDDNGLLYSQNVND